jgi:hypothetical protein
MRNKNNFNERNAVAGVIEALLLVALVAIILSTIQLLYIPQVMEQREADHMDEVSNQFSFIKSMIDLQGMTQEDVPISSPITLGSNALPYFVTLGATGEVEIIEDANFEINVDYDALRIPLTSIKYTAFNAYYLDGADLIYALEGGAIILNQTVGEVIIVEPAIKVDNFTNTVNIYYDISIIRGITGKKNSPRGFDIVFIRTNYSSSDANYISMSDVSSIKISTVYTDAWNKLLQELLEENVDYIQGSNYVEITKKVKQINFYYKRFYIYAQISPGWIR